MIEDTGEIGKHLALIAAVAAAMQLFLSPTLHAQVEALQASGLVSSRYGGVAANILGVIYGLALGVLGMLSTDTNDLVLLGVGILAGLVTGGGAVIADQRNDGLMARKLERAEVTRPQVITVAGEGPAATPPAESPSPDVRVVMADDARTGPLTGR